MTPILYSLQKCIKCDLAESYLHIDYEKHVFPKDFSQWTDKQKEIAKEVIDDLAITAPVLVVNGTHYVGVLAIKKFMEEKCQNLK